MMYISAKMNVKKVVTKLRKIYQEQIFFKFLKGGVSIANENNCPAPCAFCQDSKKTKRQIFSEDWTNSGQTP